MGVTAWGKPPKENGHRPLSAAVQQVISSATVHHPSVLLASAQEMAQEMVRKMAQEMVQEMVRKTRRVAHTET